MAQEVDIALLDRNLAAIEDDISGFKLKWKEDSWLHRTLGKVWKFYGRANTTLYPNVWADDKEEWEQDPRRKARVMQHEWVHLKDAETFYGLMPRVLRWLNVIMFSVAYASPQILALLALSAPLAILLGAPVEHWWLLSFLLLLLPFPAYGRMKGEMRAYRRTVELGADPELLVEQFTGSNYYWMWPFRKYVLRELKKPSPYKELMDKVWLDV